VVGVEEEGTSYIAYADVASWKYKLEVVSLTMRSSAH
jgi:myo-inositol-hexaphosphate 3-phosphohydrolase